MVRLCPNCNTENLLDAVFCSQCGMSLTGAAKEQDALPRSELRRRVARVLAVMWAASWTLSLLAFALLSGFMLAATFPHTIPPDWWITLALLVLPSWIAAAIPWRSERVGGVALVVVGILLFTLTTWMCLRPVQGFVLLFAPFALPELAALIPLLLFAGFPLVPGTLLLANWWKSRTPAPPQATE